MLCNYGNAFWSKYMISSKHKINFAHTISWLSEQSVVRVDDLTRQNVKPLPNHSLALDKSHPEL